MIDNEKLHEVMMKTRTLMLEMKSSHLYDNPAIAHMVDSLLDEVNEYEFNDRITQFEDEMINDFHEEFDNKDFEL